LAGLIVAYSGVDTSGVFEGPATASWLVLVRDLRTGKTA
jgi:hypothetical protein